MPGEMSLHPIDYAIIGLYFAFVLGIGWALKRFMKTPTKIIAGTAPTQ
jgi:hypothetical protein